MQKTKKRETNEVLAVDLDGLAAMLTCGKSSARKIGEQANARIVVGRRVLYHVVKVQRYLECVAE